MSMNTSNQRFSRQYWLRLLAFSIFVILATALGLLVYYIHLQVTAFVTPNRQPISDSPAANNLPYEEITLTTADGLKIAGWYIPGSRPEAIVVVHGLSANRSATLPEATILAEAGFHVLPIDLRGNGQSDASPNTYGYYEALDVQAAVDFLEKRPGVDHIGAVGSSLGGAVVARAAALDSRLEAVVIASSFSSLPEAVEDAFDDMSIFPSWPFGPLLISLAERRVGLEIGQVNSARDLASIKPRAVLLIHGAEDALFPVRHAQRMYQAAGEPKELWVIQGFGHGNPAVEFRAEYRVRVVDFFERAFDPAE